MKIHLFQVGQEVVILSEVNIIFSGKIIQFLSGNKVVVKPSKRGFETQTFDMDNIIQINGISRPIIPYFQPRLTDEQWETGELSSFDVYRHFKHCKEDYPDVIIDTFVGSQIEDHTFVDDIDYRSTEHFVDMPNHDNNGDSSNLYQTFSEIDAKVFAQVHFGADVNGMICILSQS